MNTYHTIIKRLLQAASSLHPKLDLENAREFQSALEFPDRAYPVIHIAGSNGKGSVSAKIAKVLELCGYRVGLYTSPHLFSFCERITINGQLISEEDVILGMQKIFELKSGGLAQNASFFELATFLAFEYFRQQKVDVAVIETGLGGRLDATNVASPLLTVITSISREHAYILGDDLEQIAEEKAGILKEHTPLILGPNARFQSIYDRAKLLQCSVYASKKISYFFDEENSAIAQLALSNLSSRFKIDPEVIDRGLSFRPPCRFEENGEVIFDVAHNPDAIFHLLQALHTFYPKKRCRFLVGFSKDKEYGLCLEMIANAATHIYLVQADSPRAATIEELKQAFQNKDAAIYSCHPDIAKGVREARRAALDAGELLVICGSFYIMAATKAALNPEVDQPQELRGLNEKIFPSALSSSFN